jgi:hypothetical protein
MIQRIFLIFLLCFSTTALAEIKPYPDKWEKYETLDDLQGTYWKIYKGTNSDPGEEILTRMGWHVNESTEGELNSNRKLMFSKIDIDNRHTLFDQIRNMSELERIYEYERGMLRLEDDISLRNWTISAFVNDSLEDSPFDVIEDLNDIEETLFGEKFKKLEDPLFLIYDEGQVEGELILGSENWQDGREVTLQDYLHSRQYKRDNSITGTLAGLEEYSKELNSRPLISGNSTHTYHESTTKSETSGDTYGGDLVDYSPPAPDDDIDPEQETLDKLILGSEQYGTIKDQLTSAQNLALYKNINIGKKISDVLFETEKEDFLSAEELKAQLKIWDNRMEYREEQKSQELIYPRIERWNQDIETFLEGLFMVRRIWEEFLKKPAR